LILVCTLPFLAKFEVVTAALLSIQVFGDVTLFFFCLNNVLSLDLLSVSAQTLPVEQAVLVFLMLKICCVGNASATASYGKTN
jgi:hypothetical protein